MPGPHSPPSGSTPSSTTSAAGRARALSKTPQFPVVGARASGRSTNLAPVAWVETESLSFVARHEVEDTDSAQRTLDALEDLRLRLEERFDEVPGDITVIVHPTPGWT